MLSVLTEVEGDCCFLEACQLCRFGVELVDSMLCIQMDEMAKPRFSSMHAKSSAVSMMSHLLCQRSSSLLASGK
jgi:hypothetical protein